MIRSFGDGIVNGKIDETNNCLLLNILKFNGKSRPKTKANKERKKILLKV